jgi:flagellar biosynthesis/type III secretory pathway protein FliH
MTETIRLLRDDDGNLIGAVKEGQQGRTITEAELQEMRAPTPQEVARAGNEAARRAARDGAESGVEQGFQQGYEAGLVRGAALGKASVLSVLARSADEVVIDRELGEAIDQEAAYVRAHPPKVTVKVTPRRLSSPSRSASSACTTLHAW